MVRTGSIRIALAFCVALCTLVPAWAQVDQAALANEADGRNWAAWGRTFSEQRFSPLAQIDRTSVKRLGLAWTLELPDMWNVSTAPVAVDGVIYFASSADAAGAVAPALQSGDLVLVKGSRGTRCDVVTDRIVQERG